MWASSVDSALSAARMLGGFFMAAPETRALGACLYTVFINSIKEPPSGCDEACARITYAYLRDPYSNKFCALYRSPKV